MSNGNQTVVRETFRRIGIPKGIRALAEYSFVMSFLRSLLHKGQFTKQVM
jgi:hypothetical protein